MSATRPFAADRTAWMAVLVAIAAVYLYQAPYFQHLNNPNENVRVYMTRSIVEHGTFAIDDVISEWGYVNDKATFEGRMYPGKGPGTSYAGVPAYWVHYQVNQALGRRATKQEIVMVCRLGGAVLPLLLFLYAFARATERVESTPAVRMLAVVALALGSTLLTYGGMFASHAITAACLFGAYLLSFTNRETPESWWPPFMIGFLVAAAPVFEYPGALGGAVVGLTTLATSPRKVRFIGWSALGMVIPLGLLALFHWKAFGGPLELPYAHLENPEFVRQHSAGFFGMEHPSVVAAHGTYFAPYNGLFWFLPWTIVPGVGLALAVKFHRLRETAAVTLAMLVVYSVFIAYVFNWRGGWTAGPRYVVPIVPFLAWYMLVLLAEVRRTPLGVPVMAITFGLVLVSQVNCGISAAMFPHFPEGVQNPIFEIAFDLAARGYAPHSFGTWLGVAGVWSLVPLAIAHFVAFAVPVGRMVALDAVEKFTVGVVAVALCCAISWRQSEPRTHNVTTYRYNRALVADLWEPIGPRARLMARRGGLPSDVRYGRASAAELREVARIAARRGLSETAAQLYERASRTEE